MLVCQPCRDAATRRALKKANLEQKRLVDVFDRIDFLAEHGRNCADANGASIEPFDNGAQQFPIDFIEAVFVDVEKLQSARRHFCRDSTVALHLSEIA